MPDFYVVPYEGVSTPIERRIWTDPASATRSSRIAPINDQQHRFLRLADNDVLRLYAIISGAVSSEADTVVGKFTAWCIEHPAPTPPKRNYPLGGFSSVVEWTLYGVGHYLFAMRHEDDGSGAPKAAAGGVVLVHVDVTGS